MTEYRSANQQPQEIRLSKALLACRGLVPTLDEHPSYEKLRLFVQGVLEHLHTSKGVETCT